ncbi:MAG: hypothetical protein ACE5I8_10620 [Thermodesulfobacteriota bacterium]
MEADDLAPPLFKIDWDGNWYHQGVKVTHDRARLYLYRLLDQEAGTGRFFIQNEEGRWEVEVQDAPFVVTRVEALPSPVGSEPSSLLLTLNDGTDEPFQPSTLRFTEEHIPYCRVKGGRFEARFTRPSYYQLTRFIRYDEEEDGFYFLFVGKRQNLFIPEEHS